jgi:hypothetical protein
MNKVVAHYRNGALIKGYTNDFIPTKERFHITDEHGALPREISLSDLKGLYFVKDLEGDLGHAKSNLFASRDLTPGRRLKVAFKDGEVMNGITQGYTPDRLGFFVVPADRGSNTERVFIITSATAQVSFI